MAVLYGLIRRDDMSNYDQTAIASDPEFYLSSASMSDQSGKSLYVLDNDALNTGQPIIAGNQSSFIVDSTHTINLDLNCIFFRSNCHMELVGYFTQPTENICIFGDDDTQNGIFIDQSGIELRFVDSNLSSKYTRVEIAEWPLKAHITLTFDVESATLDVNDVQSQISYSPTDPGNIADVTFKSTGQYFYLLDGFGVYSNRFLNKSNMIDAKDFDYFNFTSSKYEAVGSVFSGYRLGESKIINKSDFMLHPDGYYMVSYIMIPQIDDSYDYITFECNDPDVIVTYKVNALSETSFTTMEEFFPVARVFSISFKVSLDDINKSFWLRVKAYYEGSITTQTPGKLILDGAAFYSDSNDIKIVDCPPGHYLGGSNYDGTWYDTPPNSVEIAFMALDLTNETFVFSSTDGEASFGAGGSITGYTAYLNGVAVANLNNVRVNQWNHLVLTKVSVSDTQFILNDSQAGGEQSNIRYLFINAYPSVLTAGTIQQLYRIVTSSHKLRIVETLSPIVEGEAEYDSPFLLYSYAWSIIGSNVG